MSSVTIPPGQSGDLGCAVIRNSSSMVFTVSTVENGAAIDLIIDANLDGGRCAISNNVEKPDPA